MAVKTGCTSMEPAESQRVRRNTAGTQKCSGYAETQRVHRNAAGTQKCSGYAETQQVCRNAAGMQKYSGYAEMQRVTLRAEKGLLVTQDCHYTHNWISDSVQI